MSNEEYNAEQDGTSESEDLERAAESAEDQEATDEIVEASPDGEPEDPWASDDEVVTPSGGNVAATVNEDAEASADGGESALPDVDADPVSHDETDTEVVADTGEATVHNADAETVHDGALWEDSPVSDSLASERDPWVRVLMVTALSLVVVLLVTTVAFYFYTNTLNDAPRTAAEHAIAKSEVAVAESPKYIGSWKALAYAYAGAGRYDEALAAVAKGEKLSGGETLATVRGNILMMAGRSQEAVRAYDRAEVKVKEFLERVKTERAKVGITVEIDNDLMFAVYYGRAKAKRAAGDDAGAIKDYELASEENPYQTDVWVGLGELYEKAGKTDKARDAYESALQFVDDLKPALDGLKRVGKGE